MYTIVYDIIITKSQLGFSFIFQTNTIFTGYYSMNCFVVKYFYSSVNNQFFITYVSIRPKCFIHIIQ